MDLIQEIKRTVRIDDLLKRLDLHPNNGGFINLFISWMMILRA